MFLKWIKCGKSLLAMLLLGVSLSLIVERPVGADDASTDPSAKKPNIIMFLVDDMGWQDTSVPFWDKTTPLNRIYRTPNMERLATQGMKLTQAYASPICSPTRVSLLTGLNAARHRVTNWTLRKDQSVDVASKELSFPAWNVNGLCQTPKIPRTIQTKCLPEYLREANYRTIMVGKAHFGAIGTPGADPKNLGFDVNIGGHAAGGPGSYLGENNYSNKDPSWTVPHLEKYHGSNIFLTEALTLEALKAVDEAVVDKKPFFLYMSHYAVHIPFAQDPRFYKKYVDAGLNKTEAMYAALVEGMDKSLGDIMDHLDKNKLSDNTIILFMSDNGGISVVARGGKPDTHNLPLSCGKGSPREGGIREPMLVKWPGVTRPGSVCNDYLIIEDFFPSILEMAGCKATTAIDGISFVPMLKGASNSNQNRPLIWHVPNNWGFSNTGYGPFSSIRQGDWKYIFYHNPATKVREELFNIREDIGETRNLANEMPEKRTALASSLKTYLTQVDAQMPKDKVTGKLIEIPGFSDNVTSAQQCVTASNVSDNLVLKVLPLPAASRASLTDNTPRAYITADPNWFTWCPSILRGNDGKYHMFHSRWPRHTTFNGWMLFSEVAHAVSDKPEGPYLFVDIALKNRGEMAWNAFGAHNPKIEFFEGKYYIYHIGTKGEADETQLLQIAKTGGHHPSWGGFRNNQATGVSVSESLAGPWRTSSSPIVEPVGPISKLAVNPAVCRGPDGTYFMIVKGDKPGSRQRNQAIATAKTPEGPFIIQPQPVIDKLDTEDVSMWYDKKRCRFYAVFHAHTFIGMMTTVDGLHWAKAANYVVCKKMVPFDDGVNWTADHMERPFVLTDEQGQAQLLFVAVKKGDRTFNLGMPLSTVE